MNAMCKVHAKGRAGWGNESEHARTCSLQRAAALSVCVWGGRDIGGWGETEARRGELCLLTRKKKGQQNFWKNTPPPRTFPAPPIQRKAESDTKQTNTGEVMPPPPRVGKGAALAQDGVENQRGPPLPEALCGG